MWQEKAKKGIKDPADLDKDERNVHRDTEEYRKFLEKKDTRPNSPTSPLSHGKKG